MEEGDFYKSLLSWEETAALIKARGMTFLGSNEEVQSVERAIAKSLWDTFERVFSAGDVYVSCSIMVPEGTMG